MKTRIAIRLVVVLGVLLWLLACPRRIVAQTPPEGIFAGFVGAGGSKLSYEVAVFLQGGPLDRRSQTPGERCQGCDGDPRGAAGDYCADQIGCSAARIRGQRGH